MISREVIAQAVRESGALLVIQLICLSGIGLIFGWGAGIVVGFISGAAVFGFWKERREPGSMRGYLGNWKRALSATATMVFFLVFAGVPLLLLAVLLTPAAAGDWKQMLIDYNLSGEQLILRTLIVGILGLGLISLAHLFCTRAGFKLVAVAKR